MVMTLIRCQASPNGRPVVRASSNPWENSQQLINSGKLCSILYSLTNMDTFMQPYHTLKYFRGDMWPCVWLQILDPQHRAEPLLAEGVKLSCTFFLTQK